MSIYKEVVKDILYEVEHKEEMKAKWQMDDTLYYAHMTGRMIPILEAIVKSDNIK